MGRPVTTVESAAQDREATQGVRRRDRSTLAKGGALNLVGMGLYGALNFGLIVIVTRRLGATGAGAFIEAIGVFNILTKTALLGADTGLLRFVPQLRASHQPEHLGQVFRTALWPVVILGSLAGLLVFALAHPLADLISTRGGTAQLETYLRVMAPFIPAGAAYLVLESGARSLGTMVPSLMVERIARPFLQPAAFLLVVSAGLGSVAVGLSWAAPTGLALVPMAVWVVVLVRRARSVDRAAAGVELSPSPTVESSDLVRQFWRFSVPRAFGGMFQVLVIWLDAILIGALASTREAGIYGATTRWLIIGSFAAIAIMQAIGPQISYVLARREQARAKHLFEVSTAWQILVAFPPYITVMVFAPVLLKAFGTGFESGRSTLLILGFANLFAAACGPVEVVLLMTGRSTLNLIDSAISLAVNIGLNVLLVPSMGITGAAIAWAASLFVSNAVPMIQVWTSTGLHPYGRIWGHAFVIGAAVAAAEGVAALLFGQTLAGLLAGVALASGTLVASLTYFRDELEIADLLAAVRRRQARAQTGEAEMGLTP